jgi:signal transduction histidine kinase
MMGIVSHDLRNPANAVKMLARSITEGPGGRALPGDVRDRIEVIRQAAEQIDALIQDLLDITRLEAGRLVVTRRNVALGPLIARSIGALRPLADAGGVALHAEPMQEPAVVLGDSDRLIQLFSNVIGNAIKFTPAGGVVTLATRVDGDVAELTVRDTGEGIPVAQLPHVFDRFYQGSLSARATRHGAGLGLPISRGIVEAHGGRIWIESASGVGTTVRFTLPLAGNEGAAEE